MNEAWVVLNGEGILYFAISHNVLILKHESIAKCLCYISQPSRAFEQPPPPCYSPRGSRKVWARCVRPRTGARPPRPCARPDPAPAPAAAAGRASLSTLTPGEGRRGHERVRSVSCLWCRCPHTGRSLVLPAPHPRRRRPSEAQQLSSGDQIPASV